MRIDRVGKERMARRVLEVVSVLTGSFSVEFVCEKLGYGNGPAAGPPLKEGTGSPRYWHAYPSRVRWILRALEQRGIVKRVRFGRAVMWQTTRWWGA